MSAAASTAGTAVDGLGPDDDDEGQAMAPA